MSALSQKNLVLIGYTASGRAYLDVLAEFPDVRLVGVVETDPVLAAEALKMGLPVAKDVNELLETGCAPNVAIVCTAPALRLHVMEPLLHAGIDVLMEPPIAVQPLDADHISATAERLGRVAQTASRFAFIPALQQALDQIQRGRIGRLCLIEAVISEKLNARASEYRDPNRWGSGIWLAQAAHGIDLVESLGGPLQRIRMLSAQKIQNAPIEDEVQVESDHGRGIVSRIRMSWNEEASAPLVRCIGDQGEILIGHAQSLIRTETGEEIICKAIDFRELYRLQLADFLDRRIQRELAVDHGAQASAWIHTAYDTLRTGTWHYA